MSNDAAVKKQIDAAITRDAPADRRGRLMLAAECESLALDGEKLLSRLINAQEVIRGNIADLHVKADELFGEFVALDDAKRHPRRASKEPPS
jgi:hypothetical protein